MQLVPSDCIGDDGLVDELSHHYYDDFDIVGPHKRKNCYFISRQ